MTFAACLPVILQSEGGFVIDQGGPTNLGVTMPALQAWLHRPVTEQDIRNLTPATVGPLYEADYFNAAHCNELPNGVDLMVFDEAVNEGVGRAIRHLQSSVGATADGIFGDQTRAAVAVMIPSNLIRVIHATNAEYYASLDSIYPQDEKGWTARNDRTMALALQMT